MSSSRSSGKSARISACVMPLAKPAQHIRHGDPHPPDARTAPAFAWFQGDDVLIVHVEKVVPECELAKPSIRGADRKSQGTWGL